MDDYLIGVRLRPTAQADDYRVGDLELHVGDLVFVETGSERRHWRDPPTEARDPRDEEGSRLPARGAAGDRGGGARVS